MRTFFEAQIIPEGSAFHIAAVRTTPNAVYCTWQQTYQDIIIEDALIKSCVSKNGLISLRGNYLTQKPQEQFLDINTGVIHQVLRLHGLPETTSVYPIYKIVDEQVQLCWYADDQSGPGRKHQRLYLDASGNVLEARTFTSYFALPDTVVHGYVFLPDPITSAETDYAGDYKDFNDEDNEALNAERMEVLLPAQFEEDTFYLRTENILLADLNAPTIPIAKALTDTFFFTRSASGFEDVQVLFHITNFQSRLSEIGYEALTDFYIEVDPHGASGADQSFYVSADIPSIQFGEGGVEMRRMPM